jgi:type IV secretion system pilin
MSFTKKFIKYGIISVIILISLLTLNLPIAQATSVLPSCASSGNCSVCEIVQTAINIGQFILGIIGAVVLLFFVYGGFIMLTSGGKPDWVKKGKDILINAVIGLAIAFFAYTIVTFVVNTVSKDDWSWENKLNCAGLPGPIQYTAPDKDTQVPTGGPGGGPTDTPKPTDAPPTPTGKECITHDDCDTATQFCWGNPGNLKGNCEPKKDHGESCPPSLLITTIPPGSPNVLALVQPICKGMCNNNLTCVAQDGTGANGVWCNKKEQCKSTHCWEYGDKIKANGEGQCADVAKASHFCGLSDMDGRKQEFWDDMPCQSGYKCQIPKTIDGQCTPN